LSFHDNAVAARVSAEQKFRRASAKARPGKLAVVVKRVREYLENSPQSGDIEESKTPHPCSSGANQKNCVQVSVFFDSRERARRGTARVRNGAALA